MTSPNKVPKRAGSRRQSIPLIILSAVGLLLGNGCLSNPSYVVTLHDGRVYRSAQAPVLDSKTGYYKFRDRYGRDVLLRDREVSAIAKDPPRGTPAETPVEKKEPRR